MEVDPTQPAVLPAAPVPLVSSDQSLPQATLTAIKSTLDTESGFREALLATAKEMLRHAQQGSHGLHAGSSAGASLTASMTGYAELAAQCAKDVELTRYTRGHGLIQSACTECISAGCFQHFLEKGKLKPMGDFPGATDAEYLSGAIQFCQELGRYAVGRATVGDASSVLLCKNLVEAVFEQLLQFDFRNGPLRRKYDGVKYAVKRLEDVLYELSLTGLYVADPANAKAPVQPDPKKRKVEVATPAAAEPSAPAAAAAAPDPNALIHQPDFDRIRAEMERYDAKREDVIKRCRDVQKISKLAIYGLHRGQTAKVDKQLAQAVELSNGIYTDLIQTDPELRNGSYTNALEEFAEAVLYKVWLENGSICAMDGAEMAGLLNTKEYLGALVDFTGEVGRYAVTAAARRDQDAVRSSLAAMLAVQEGIFFLGESARGSLSKKESALKANIKKCEHLMYELSLVKASGRNVSAAKTEEGAGDD